MLSQYCDRQQIVNTSPIDGKKFSAPHLRVITYCRQTIFGLHYIGSQIRNKVQDEVFETPGSDRPFAVALSSRIRNKVQDAVFETPGSDRPFAVALRSRRR